MQRFAKLCSIDSWDCCLLVEFRFNLETSKGSVTLPHSTGLYHLLRQEVYEHFEELRDDDPEFYFVQQLGNGKDGKSIKDEFQLNAIVKETQTKSKKREISLDIKIGQCKTKFFSLCIRG